MSRHWSRVSPAAHGEVRGGPLQPREVHVGTNIHTAACGGPHTRADGCALKKAVANGGPTQEQASGRNCSLWRGAPAGAGFVAGPVTLWRTQAGAVCS